MWNPDDSDGFTGVDKEKSTAPPVYEKSTRYVCYSLRAEEAITNISPTVLIPTW